MCDAIHTPAVTDGLPVVVELIQYPPVFDGPAGHTLAAALSDLASARARQIACGYGDEHDDEHSAEEMEQLIRHQLRKAAAETNDDGYRRRLVKVAACALAALLSWDRYLAARDAVAAEVDEKGASHG